MGIWDISEKTLARGDCSAEKKGNSARSVPWTLKAGKIKKAMDNGKRRKEKKI